MSQQILRFLDERGCCEQERIMNRFLEGPIHGELVIVRRPPEHRVTSDSIFLDHFGIEKPNAGVSERTEPKVGRQTTEQRSGPPRGNALHHANATSAKHHRRTDLAESRVPMMLQAAHGLGIGCENSLKFVKHDELSIELTNMVKKRIP